MKKIKNILCFVIAIAMITAGLSNTVEAATKAKISKKKVILTITDSKKNPSVTLKMKGVSKKIAKKAKWSTSNKTVATVKKGKVTAKKAGKATITCKVKGKKYTCKVTVVDNREPIDNAALNITIVEKASETGLGPKFPLRPHADFMDMLTEDDLRQAGGGDPYGVNKIKVTYNGKDVTNEAKYKIDDTRIACMESPGVIRLTNQGMLFKLTVSYNGAKRIFRMGKTTVAGSYILCYCGKLFSSNDICKPGNRCNSTNYCPSCEHTVKNRCAGSWVIQYVRYYDIRVK